MKKYKIAAIVFFICALAFYAFSIFSIFNDSAKISGVAWMCVGSMWLCLGALFLNKTPSDSDLENDDDLDGDDK